MAAVAADLEGNGAAPDADDFVRDVREWCANEKLIQRMTTTELSLLEKHPSAWTPREVIDATWRQESIGVLLWALGTYSTLPPYDTEFSDVPDMVNVLEPTRESVKGARLRSADEIERQRDVAELWHWRSRTTRLQTEPEHADVRAEHDLDEIVRSTATHAHAQGDIPEPIDGDFPAFGRAYRSLTEDEYAVATSIAMERHFALNWLCGYSANWDETPTDT